MNALLIVGTNTETGKTVLTSALGAYWQTYREAESLGILKLIQTGIGDRELYQKLFNLNQSSEEIAPVQFQTPVAPPVAAEREGRSVDLELVWEVFNTLRQQRQWVMVEALGGLGSPVTHELIVADIARDWGLSAVLVVPVQLGAISQAVANVALARASGVKLQGIVLNCVSSCSEQEIADWTPIDLLQSLTNIPVLGTIPHLDDPTDLSQLAQVASDLDLERLIPSWVVAQYNAIAL